MSEETDRAKAVRLEREYRDALEAEADYAILDPLRGELEEFAKVKDEYLPRNYPAWTAVGVTQLALPELRIEVRAVAVAGSGKD